MAAHQSHLLPAGQQFLIPVLPGAGWAIRTNLPAANVGHWLGLLRHLGLDRPLRLRHFCVERLFLSHQRGSHHCPTFLLETTKVRQTSRRGTYCPNANKMLLNRCRLRRFSLPITRIPISQCRSFSFLSINRMRNGIWYFIYYCCTSHS